MGICDCVIPTGERWTRKQGCVKRCVPAIYGYYQSIQIWKGVNYGECPESTQCHYGKGHEICCSVVSDLCLPSYRAPRDELPVR